MGYYPASGGNFLPKFWGNVSVPSAGLKNPKESLLFQYGVLYTEEVEIQFVSTKFCRHICLKALLTAVLVSYPEIARCVAVMYNIGLNFFVYEYLNVNVQCNLKIPHKSKWF